MGARHVRQQYRFQSRRTHGVWHGADLDHLHGWAHLHETLSRQLSLADVISRKVRRAVETGGPFVRVRDLF